MLYLDEELAMSLNLYVFWYCTCNHWKGQTTSIAKNYPYLIWHLFVFRRITLYLCPPIYGLADISILIISGTGGSSQCSHIVLFHLEFVLNHSLLTSDFIELLYYIVSYWISIYQYILFYLLLCNLMISHCIFANLQVLKRKLQRSVVINCG